MERSRVVVACDDCSFESTHAKLRSARTTLDDHRSETGHAVDWRIESLSGGVERAGAAAGVCGIPGLADEDSPLLRPDPPGADHADRSDSSESDRADRSDSSESDRADRSDGSENETDLDRAGDDEDRAGDSR